MPPQENFSAVPGPVNGDLSPRGPSSDGLSTSSDGLAAIEEKHAKNRKNLADSQDNRDEIEEQPKDMDFDDLLPHIGEFGTYQRILFVLMIPFAFFVAWVYFSQIFITLVPDEYWCRVPELENLTREER